MFRRLLVFSILCNEIAAEQLNYDLQVHNDYESIYLHGYDNIEVTSTSDAAVDYWITKKSDFDDWVESGYISTVRVVSGAMCNDCTNFFFNFSVSASDSHVVVISGMYPPNSADVEMEIHASKPPDDSGVDCFSADSLLTLADGRRIPITDVSVGDSILGVDALGRVSLSPVVYIPHALNAKPRDFVAISYILNNEVQTLEVTPKHLIRACTSHDCTACTQSNLLKAQDITLQTCISVSSTGGLLWQHPTNLTTLRKQGVYSLVTNNPFLLVNGVVASPYEVNHMVPNFFYTLHRYLYASVPLDYWAAVLKRITDNAAIAVSGILSI